MDTDFRAWIGRTEQVEDALGAAQALAAQATFDETDTPIGDGQPLPLPWHWFYFLPRAAQSLLDADGHPQRGGFLPPIPYPRRMFAGARITVHQPLRVALPALREGTIRDVVLKSGKSGSLAFVTVAYRFLQQGVLCLEEEQDIVYRESGGRVAAPQPVTLPALPEGCWSRTLQPDTRLLFRFSALTFNAHRIHYDRRYATQVEGYPGLVVHGPLTAVLLADLVTRGTGALSLKHFSFRARSAFYLGDRITLLGKRQGDRIKLTAMSDQRVAGLTANATLA